MTEYAFPFRSGQRILELGGGDSPCHRPNADVRWGPAVDYPGVNMNHPLPFKDGEWDALHLRHVVEHISWRSVSGLLRELHRVLRPGGIAVVETPNLTERCRIALEWYSDGREGMVSECLFGSQEFGVFWDAGAHHSGLSPSQAVTEFKAAGFFKVLVFPVETDVGPTDMIIEAHKSAAVVETPQLGKTPP